MMFKSFLNKFDFTNKIIINNKMEKIPLNVDTLTNILLRLELKDLSSMCKTNRQIAHICDNSNFWKAKIRNEFGDKWFDPNNSPIELIEKFYKRKDDRVNYKQYYIDILYNLWKKMQIVIRIDEDEYSKDVWINHYKDRFFAILKRNPDLLPILDNDYHKIITLSSPYVRPYTVGYLKDFPFNECPIEYFQSLSEIFIFIDTLGEDTGIHEGFH